MEAAVRLGVFLAVFAAVAIAEWRAPRRLPTMDRAARWRINLSIFVLDVIAQRLTLGAAAYGAALWADAQGWGLLRQIDAPPLLAGLAAFVLLDLAIYLQHVAFHASPTLWRLHRVHHADLDMDLTTGLRFHPGEILLSLMWKTGVVVALGADPWTVVVFEAVLNGAALYTHGNLRIPVRVDRAIRRVFCTPDMHRVHHSTVPVETNSNYGNFLSVWDRLFGTMRTNPARGQDGVEIGLAEARDPTRLGLPALLLMPFR